jgi:hypothetical protein
MAAEVCFTISSKLNGMYNKSSCDDEVDVVVSSSAVEYRFVVVDDGMSLLLMCRLLRTATVAEKPDTINETELVATTAAVTPIQANAFVVNFIFLSRSYLKPRV